MRFMIVLIVLFVCVSVQGQTAADLAQRLEGFNSQQQDGLNSQQQKAVDAHIRQFETRTGELRIVAQRSRIPDMRSYEALRTLFPKYRFVALKWIYDADPAALHKYSIPGPIYQLLVLDENGRNWIPNRNNFEEYGDLLRAERIKVTDDTSADLVRWALLGISGGGMSSTNLRRGNSEWLLGYEEWPFHTISGYEEIRDAYYYLVSVDSSGVVVSGRLVNEVLERRKVKTDGPNR